ncbi:hypothetical protein [Burkholderia ubonensis]|uniref:hypothetical protein n=1 Tax=Burkholderia ubonensis TaxID=101571 RepID=UPI0012F8C729|nr:hypothetical protein [Burkholderia ubonensis]
MAHPSNIAAALSEELLRHVGNSETVVRTGDYANDHVDRRGKCHENVAQWLGEHPGDRPVRGWLIDQSQVQYGFIEFLAHSVVVAAGGGLMDVTLGANDPDYKFLRDERPDDEFLALASAWPKLRHIVDQARYDAFQLAMENSLLCGRFDSED